MAGGNDGPNPANMEASFGVPEFHGQTNLSFTEFAGMNLRGGNYMGYLTTGLRSDLLIALGTQGIFQKLVDWPAYKCRLVCIQ